MPSEEVIKAYARQVFSASGEEAIEWALATIDCESGYNPLAYNEKTGCWGLFQFKPGTFFANAQRLEITNPDLYDWSQQIEVAQYMYSIGQKGQWDDFNYNTCTDL